MEGRQTKAGRLSGERGINARVWRRYEVEVVNDVLELKEVGGLLWIELAPYSMDYDVDRPIRAVEKTRAAIISGFPCIRRWLHY